MEGVTADVAADVASHADSHDAPDSSAALDAPATRFVARTVAWLVARPDAEQLLGAIVRGVSARTTATDAAF
jgi:hypothetical protein